jgi:hypothetical protein
VELCLNPIKIAVCMGQSAVGTARDRLLILMIHRHGLCVSAAVGLRGDQVNLLQTRIWIERLLQTARR